MKKVVIYNGFNGTEVEDLKNIDEKVLKEKRDLYDKFANLWFFSGDSDKEFIWHRTIFLEAYLVIGMSLLIFMSGNEWKTVGGIIAAYSIFKLGQKYGHKKGFFDGYEIGVGDGVDKALGIDERDKKLITNEMQKHKEGQADFNASILMQEIEQANADS